MSREEEIRLIANRLWEESGKGNGQEIELWLAAEAIWEEKHKNLWAIIRASSKRVFKASAYMAAFISVLFFVPYLLLLLLFIDDPKFGQALAGLTLAGFFLFIFGFIGFLIIFYIIVIILSIWRKYHLLDSIKRSVQNQRAKNQVTTKPLATLQSGILIRSSARRFIFLLVGGISALIYLIYYVGRAYSESYYASLGIPKSFVHFEIQDYIYFGAQVDTILIAGAFTAVFVGLLIALFYKKNEIQVSSSTHVTNKINTIFAIGYLVWFDLALILFVYWQIFRPDLLLQKPAVLSILMACLITLGLLIVVLFFDPDTFFQIKRSKVGHKIFITAAVITLIFTPYMSGEAWGAFKAQLTKLSDFPKVELYANTQLTDNIKWVTIDKITYRSDQDLYEVGKTVDYVFLKTSDEGNNVYIFKLSDLSSIKILGQGQTK